MKKLLSLVLVLAVVLSSMSFAFAAPSDLGDYKYADAVKKLVGLGIINGYPDGTFKPTGNITRAEFAKVVVTALGYADAATAAGDAKFSDMTGHWAIGFVNVASSLGIINGVGGGKFAPDANVKYEEAVTMIVRALGYEPAAKSNGGYPNGYLTIASQKKITKDVAMVAGTVADRGTVAKLMAESLEVPFLEQTGYGTLTTFSEAKDSNGDATKSLLITGLKLTKYTPTVDSYDTTAKTITFTGYDVDNKKTVAYVDPIDPSATKNCQVTVWYKDSTIYSFKNETTVKFDRLKKVNGVDVVAAGNDADTTFLKKVELQQGGVFDSLQNNANTAYTGVLKRNDNDFTAKVSGLIGDFAKIYVKDGKMYRVETFDVTSAPAGLIAEASATKVKYQGYDANDLYLSNIDSNSDLLYVSIDGVEKSAADLKADMFMQYWQGSKKLVIAASTVQAKGKLTAFSKDTATIGGTAYDTVGDNAAGTTKYISVNGGTKFDQNKLDDLVGIDVVGYKNFANKLAFIKGTATSSTNDFYGMINSIQYEGKSITLVRDVNGVSTEVTYAVKTDTDENKVNGTANYVHWSQTAGFTAARTETGNNTSADVPDRIYKFWINSDNKIIKMQTLANASGAQVNYAIGTVTKFNKDTGVIEHTVPGNNYYGDGATIFDLTGDKVRYWNDIKDRTSTGADILSSKDTTNTSKANVVAFLNDTYKTVNATDKFYAYVTGESFDGTYYNITTSDGTTLKLHKDNVTSGVYSFKQMDKNFITYIKDGENIKVKAVAQAVYSAGTFDVTYGNATTSGEIFDENQFSGTQYTVLTADTFNKVDGDYVVFNGIGYQKKATDMKVIKINWKSDMSIDSALVSDATSIALNNKVLVIRDAANVIHAIYYFQ